MAACLNTGLLARESPFYGVERFVLSRGADSELVYLGDFVKCSGALKRGQLRFPRRGRVVAVYVHGKSGRLWVSLRTLLATAEVVEAYRPAAPPPETNVLSSDSDLWELDSVEERVPVEQVTAKLRRSRLAGQFSLRGGGTWTVKVGGGADDLGEAEEAPNPDHFPVVKLGLVTWADSFETFRTRQQSTALVACTYSPLPFPLRMSRSWVKLLSCTPSDVSQVAAFRAVFSCLLDLEKNVLLDAAPEFAGERGKVFLRAGLFMSLGDSPYQAKLASSLSPNGLLPCPLDLCRG